VRLEVRGASGGRSPGEMVVSWSFNHQEMGISWEFGVNFAWKMGF
jgi:hypothetical protein